LGAGMWHAKSPKGGGGPCRHAGTEHTFSFAFPKGAPILLCCKKRSRVGYFIGRLLFPILNCSVSEIQNYSPTDDHALCCTTVPHCYRVRLVRSG
jgi:hypothetical protein